MTSKFGICSVDHCVPSHFFRRSWCWLWTTQTRDMLERKMFSLIFCILLVCKRRWQREASKPLQELQRRCTKRHQILSPCEKVRKNNSKNCLSASDIKATLSQQIWPYWQLGSKYDNNTECTGELLLVNNCWTLFSRWCQTIAVQLNNKE